MHRCRAGLTALTVVLMSLLVAGPASAGGPTSLLMAEPDTGRTSSLYFSDPDYETLATVVGAHGADVAGTVDRSGAAHETGSMITLTWMAHDVSVWRVDRIYFAAKGGPWIASQFSLDGSQSIWDSPVVWHRVPNGKVLAALLQRAGFEPGAAGTGNDAVAEAADNAPAQPLTPAQPLPKTSQLASPTPIWGGWAWGLAGLVLGVALATAAMHVVPRVRRPAASQTASDSAEPELTAHTTPPDVDDELAWTPADELSSSGSPRN